MTFLIVGLGNPSEKYSKTRHNLGFMVADELVKKTGAVSVNTKFNADIWTVKMDDATSFIMKPSTFMNNSGQAVAPFMKSKKISPEHLILIHDDLDIPFGKIRISKDTSSAGHNGVQSVIDSLGTKDFTRVRIGIGRPTNEQPIEDYVLAKFSTDKKKVLPDIIDKSILEIEKILRQ